MYLLLITVCTLFYVNYVFSANNQSDINSVFTYTPPGGWVSDPNGCVYVNGKYHLMYQYNPSANSLAEISWGHSVSDDLIVWQDYGVSIPYNTTRSVFSGNAVYDEENTSNFCEGNKSPIVAFYTGGFHESLKTIRKGAQVISSAYSCDDDYRNYTEYAMNPVVAEPPKKYEDQWQNMRDPSVFWYEPHKRWIMSFVLSIIRKVIWVASNDLVNWEYVGEFSWPHTPDGDLECPSLAEFRVENTNETRWVLLLSTNPGGIYGGSGMFYYVGHFDGYSFVNDNTSTSDEINWLDYGADSYAGILWNNIADEKIMTIWFNNWRYSVEIANDVYKGALNTRKLQLRRTNNDEYKLYQAPIDSIYKYTKQINYYLKIQLLRGIELPKNQSYKLDLSLETNTQFHLRLIASDTGNLTATLNYKSEDGFTIERPTPELKDNSTETHHYGLQSLSDVSILLDNYTLTVYLNDGETVFSELILDNSTNSRMLYIDNTTHVRIATVRTMTI